jgi:hypothetical protein
MLALVGAAGTCAKHPRKVRFDEIIGSLNFRKGLLTHVRKKWGPKDPQKDTDFAKTLHGAFSELIDAGKAVCTVSVSQKHAPGMEHKELVFTCGVLDR